MTTGSTGLREELIRIGRELDKQKMIVAAEGNLSANLGGGFFLVTPSGARKGGMAAEDLVLVDLQGIPADSSAGRVSSEWKMHQAIYSHRPDVSAICHAHPPCATAFAAARRTLSVDLLPECVLILGDIALSAYSTPGTDEVPNALIGLLPYHNVILLANHGVVAVGSSPEEAFRRMELTERLATITLLTDDLGGGVHLTALEKARILHPESQQ